MKTGQSKQQLKQRLRQKMTESADLQLDSLATELESFTNDIKELATRALHTTAADIDALTKSMEARITLQMRNCELWTEKAETAARLMKAARVNWMRDGVFTLILPMLIGALSSGIIGGLVVTLMVWTPPPPIQRTPPTPGAELTTGLGGVGQVLRHPPGSEVVPCPLRSAFGSVCVKLPRENR